MATSFAGSSPVRHKPSKSWKGTLRGDIPADVVIVGACRSGQPCKFLSVSSFHPEYNSARPTPCVGPRVGGPFFADKSDSAYSGALHGCTGHWDEIWESTTCSARGSQYVDFHRVRNLWDRVFRGAGLLRFAVFCPPVVKGRCGCNRTPEKSARRARWSVSPVHFQDFEFGMSLFGMSL